MDNSVDKFPYFFAKTPISAPFLAVKTQNRISFYPCIGSFIAPKRSAWQIVAEIFRRNRFFVRSASRHVLKNIAQTTYFIEKRLFHRQGRLSPKNRESAFVYAPRGLSIPASRQEKRKKRQPVKDFPNGAPLRAGGRSQGFPFSFGRAPLLSERRRRRKEKTAPLRGQPKIRIIARYFLSALTSPEACLRRRRIFLPTCALRDRRK